MISGTWGADRGIGFSLVFQKGKNTMQPLELSHEGFKAYDIRGVVGAEVNENLAYRVGCICSALPSAGDVCRL